MINKNYFKIIDIIDKKYKDPYMFTYFVHLFNLSNTNRKAETDDYVCWISDSTIANISSIGRTKAFMLRTKLINDGYITNITDLKKNSNGKNLKCRLKINVDTILGSVSDTPQIESSSCGEQLLVVREANNKPNNEEPVVHAVNKSSSCGEQLNAKVVHVVNTYKDNNKEKKKEINQRRINNNYNSMNFSSNNIDNKSTSSRTMDKPYTSDDDVKSLNIGNSSAERMFDDLPFDDPFKPTHEMVEEVADDEDISLIDLIQIVDSKMDDIAQLSEGVVTNEVYKRYENKCKEFYTFIDSTNFKDELYKHIHQRISRSMRFGDDWFENTYSVYNPNYKKLKSEKKPTVKEELKVELPLVTDEEVVEYVKGLVANSNKDTFGGDCCRMSDYFKAHYITSTAEKKVKELTKDWAASLGGDKMATSLRNSFLERALRTMMVKDCE